MSRNEFTKPTKRFALKRAGGFCEAWGSMYGLGKGVKCGAPLSRGVQFDHIILDANSHDNSLENCAAVCLVCHGIKTSKYDTPLAAKTLRQQDKANGIKPKSRMQSRGFRSQPSNVRQLNEDIK